MSSVQLVREVKLQGLVAEYAGNVYSVVNICLDREVVDLGTTEGIIIEIPFEEIKFLAEEEEECEKIDEEEYRVVKLARLQLSR